MATMFVVGGAMIRPESRAPDAIAVSSRQIPPLTPRHLTVSGWKIAGIFTTAAER